MMSEQQHLRLLRELGQDFDSSACAIVIEVDKNVVKHKRHGLLRRKMLLNAREPQRKKELVECPSATGHSTNSFFLCGSRALSNILRRRRPCRLCLTTFLSTSMTIAHALESKSWPSSRRRRRCCCSLIMREL